MPFDANDIAQTFGDDALRDVLDLGTTLAPAILEYVDIAREPIPPRDWAVPDRIPATNVTLLSGEGAVGKSLPLLQLSAATVLGRDWIGTLPTQGPVLYINCEDDDDEICRRLEGIAQHYNVSRQDMQADLHVLSFAGRSSVLAIADRKEQLHPTPLFQQLTHDAQQIGPRLIVVDTVADTFAGQENNRAQTRQFVTMMRGLCLSANAAVILASHPSLTGINSGSGLSGSTAWHNSVRPACI